MITLTLKEIYMFQAQNTLTLSCKEAQATTPTVYSDKPYVLIPLPTSLPQPPFTPGVNSQASQAAAALGRQRSISSSNLSDISRFVVLPAILR